MPPEGITRRRFAGLLAAFGAPTRARGAEPALGLDHFKLRVSDLDRSVAFYHNLFGCHLAEIQGGSHLAPPDMRAILLKIGSGSTYMILSPPDPKVRVGLEHVAMDSAGMAVVKKNSLPLAFPPESYVFDPAGNLVEFVTTSDWASATSLKVPQLPPNVVNRQRAFEPMAVQRIALRVSDLNRAAGFYSLFAAEMPGATPRRTFNFRGAALELVSAGSSGLDGFTVAVRNFDPASVRQTLRGLGIDASDRDRSGLVSFRDPDGNRVELSPGLTAIQRRS